MSLIQQPFTFDHNDVAAAQALVEHPQIGPLLYKYLLLREQQILDDMSAFIGMGDMKKLDQVHGYHQALKEIWPSLNALAKRDIAAEQAARVTKEQKKARKPRNK